MGQTPEQATRSGIGADSIFTVDRLAPFPVGPHVTLDGQPTGVHPVVQTPLMQASVTGHVPQVIDPPQPFGQSPQTTPTGQVVTGVQVEHLPPTHAPLVQVPQSIDPPQPSG